MQNQLKATTIYYNANGFEFLVTFSTARWAARRAGSLNAVSSF
jgi:hypothetical protein